MASSLTPAGRDGFGLFVGLLERRDVQLLHLKHNLHHGFIDLLVLAFQHLGRDLGHDLPEQAELVLQPAALLRVGIAALPQLLTVVVDFLLVAADDLEGHRLVELEDGPAVEQRESLAIDAEIDGQDLSLLLAVDLLPLFPIAVICPILDYLRTEA
jgi:hypothetical protein